MFWFDNNLCQANSAQAQVLKNIKSSYNRQRVNNYNEYLKSLSLNNPSSILKAQNAYFENINSNITSLIFPQSYKDEMFDSFYHFYLKVIEAINKETLNDPGYIYRFSKVSGSILPVYDNENPKDTISLDSKSVFENYGITLDSAEGQYYPSADYHWLLNNFEIYISAGRKEYLKFCLKEYQSHPFAEGMVNIPWDELRINIIILENILKNNPDFSEKNDIEKKINLYLQAYLGNSDNSQIGEKIIQENTDICPLKQEVKQSYEKFIKENQNSKYYTAVQQRYEELKTHNFIVGKYGNPQENFKKLNTEVAKTCETFLNKQIKYKNGQNILYINAIKTDKANIDKVYKDFLVNKDNMQNNYKTYEKLIEYSNQYNEVSEGLKATLKDLFEKYYVVDFPVKTFSEYLIFAKNNIPEANKYLALCNDAAWNAKVYKKQADEIMSYSVNYEKLKQKNHPDSQIYKYSIEDLLVNKYTTFYKEHIYQLYNDYGPYMILKVIQSLPGGILVQKPYSNNFGEPKTVFIKTNKQFADGEVIKEQIYLAYTGYYSYNSFLGVRKVWAFKEVNPAHQKYYFIK